MLVRNWLEGFYRRLFPVGFGRLARNRRRQLRERRCTLHPTVAAWVDSLEERVLLATAASGEVLINSTVAGLQEFGAGSDRSFAVTPTGTLILAWGAADESSSEPAGEQGLGGTAFATTVAATTQVWARLVDVQGTPVGPQILVSDTPCLEAGNTVAGTAGSERFVVVWESTGNALDASGSGVFARLFSGDGTPLGNEFRVNLTTAGDQADPTVAWLSATSFVVGWSGAGTGDSQGVFTRVFDATGAPLTTEVQVNQQSEGVQKEPALVSLPNVGYQVAWSGAGPGDTEGIFSRPFDFTGQPLADAFRVNMLADGVQQSPALARTGSGATVLVAWQAQGEAGDTSDWGVFARQMRPTGTPVGDEFLVNQTTTGSQQNPVLVWFNEESFVVAWEGNGTGDADGVFRREFDLHNAPRIDEQLVNTTTAGVQHFPALRPYNLGYTVGWSGAGSGDDSGIFIQAFVPQNLAGWAFSPQGGTEAGRGRAELAAGNVVLREGDSFSVALSRGLVVPAAPSFVQFHFSDLQFDTTDATGINDAFEAALVDAHGDPLVHPLVVGRDASFNVTEGEPLAKSASVLLAGQTVQFDLSHLSPGTAARLVVRLVNNDRDVNTSVVVSPFEVLPGSLGTPLGIPPESNAALSSLPSRRFEQLTDVTGSVRMDYGRTTLSENPEDLATEVLLTNLGTTALHGSVLAVFDRFSDPAVSLVGPSGFLPDGRPYLDLTAFVPDGDLIQGEATGRAPLVFRNPNGAQFTYGITILAELNRSPTGFDSTPVREIASGTDYRYSAVASDPDQQALSYTLVIGPQGMAIDPATGLVTWPTQTADVGSHSITLRATDPYGQFVEQSFDLVVSATLLNRPPIFTSAPPTDAVVASPFEVLTYATGGAPAAVTAGIFGSGSVSVVTANPGDQTLGLLGGAEQGRLQPTQPLNVGEPPPAALPTAIVAPIPVDLGFSPNTYQNIERDLGVETADVNADGIPDLIAVVVTGSENYFSTASVGYVGIRLGNGDGTFRPGWQATLPAVANRSSAASEVLFADVTSDSKPDLVLAQYVGNRLLVYAGNGDGTFAPTPITSPWVGSASLMQLADFNGDGELDAAMFENNASGQFRSGIAVLMGDGAGSFGAETFYPAANDNQFAGYAIDVDGVNGPDLVRVSYVDQALIVRLNDGQGAFGAALFSTVYAIGNNGLDPLAHFVTNPISAYFGDFDHDGKIDAEVSTATLGLFFLRGTGDGHFGDGTAGGNRANIPIFQPTGFDNFPSAYHGDGLARDFNGDGELDVIFGNGASAQLFIGLGRGDGTFAQSFYNAQYTPDIGTGSVRGDTNTSTVNVADYNLDGVMDVLVVSHRNPYRPGGAAVVLGDRAGTLRAAHVVPANDSGIGPPFVTADFDNDGIPDVAAISNSIAVSLGRGDGTFAPFELGIHVPAGGGEVLAGSLITRDFDGDGNMDLAWVGLDSVQGGAPPRYLQAFGLGNGTFQLMSIINIQGGLISGATGQQEGASGDFNGDGHPDLAYRVTDGHQGSITRVDVLLYDPVAKRFNRLPDSTGLLGPIPRNTNFYRDNAIGFADLDGDGKGELFVHSTAIPAQGNASAIPERFTVYESSGAPATDAAQLFTRNVVENPGLSANSPVVSYADWDFNRDGHRDLVAQLDNGLAVVALGNGDFTFRAPTTYFTNGNGRIFVDDVTGDGLPDLVAHWAGFIPHSIRSLLSILPGRPDGTFGAAQQLAVANNNNALGLAVGDFNLDGKTDLFTSSKAQTAEAFLAAPPGLADVATGDLDGDGRLDLVAVNTGFDRVKLQLGQGSSAFARQDDLFVGASPVALQLADLDGDHRLDIVTANRVGQSITWLKNAGNGSFTRTDLALPARPERVAVADLNGDDKPDLVTISTIGRSLTVLPSGPGGFGAAMTLDLGFAAGDVALADLTGDGELDAVLSDPAGKRLLVLPGLGDGSFGAARTIALPDGPGRLAVSDLNADHKLDVVMTFSDSDKVGILFGRGDARFSTVQTISVGHTPSALHVADVNGDNRPDLLVTNAGDSTLSVILNRFDPANLYRYLPTATDPDSDPVSFDLAQAPGGMLFDDATGEILWAPMPDQVGPNAVVVQASDGRGGEATQGYTILVTAPLTTPSPVFISTPTTAIAADGTYAYQPSTTNPAGNPLRYALVNGPEGMTVDPTTGAVTWDPRENGISLALFRQDYNGVYGRGRIETPDSPSLRSASVTAEGWYKFDSNLSRAMLLRKKFFDGNFGLTNISTWGLENRGGIPRAFIGDADAPQAVIAAPAGFELGVWYHVALTFDDATRTLSFYLNGALAGTAVAPGPLNYSNEPLQIGAVENLYATVSGVRVWNVARSGSQIAADMLRDVPSDTPGLVVDYRFQEGRDAASVVDSTASQNHGGISSSYDYYNYPPRVPTLGFEGTYPVTLSVEDGRGGFALQTFDIDIVSPRRGTVTGTVFDDRDGDNQKSPGEPGLAGWTVFIDANHNGNRDSVEPATLTDALGRYTLSGLVATSVPLTVQPQSGAETPMPVNVTVPAGSTTTSDFGVRLAAPGIIRGTVRLESLNTPIRGFVVYSDANDNRLHDMGETFSTTDAEGRYVLGNLPQGTYPIRLDTPVGWSLSTPTVGGYSVDLAAGAEVSGRDFVTAPPNELSVAPVFTTVPNELATARSDYRYAPVAIDPLGRAVIFALAAAPEGMAIDPVTGIVAWKPGIDQLGSHRVLLRASAAGGGATIQDYLIAVDAPNSAPIITSTPSERVMVDVPYRYQVAAQDAEQAALTFALLQAPAGMTIDAHSGLVRWTPIAAQVGANAAIIVVTDGAGGEARQALALDVAPVGANATPTIVAAARLTAQVGAPYRGQMFATDSDGDPLEFSLVSGPAGLTISPDGFLAWEPTAAQFGENALRVRVSDGQAADEREFQIDVRSQLRNGAPRLTDAGTALAVAGKLFAADLIAADADGDPVAFELLSGPAGLSVDPARGTVRWVPAFDQLGAQSYRVRAFDPFGGFDEKTYTIQVRGIGGPPAITSIPPTEAVVGQTYIYAVAAVDVDGDPLTYALQNSPAGMLIDATTGVVTWTPQAHQVGAQPVIVRVADGTGGFATQAFSIAVSAGAINRPPVMHSTPPVDAVVGTSFVYSLQATDPEGSAVTYAKRSGPAGLTVDPATGVVHWIPTAGEIGRLVLVLTATDPGGAAAVQSLEVDVQATNNGPQINSTAPSSVPAGGLYRYDLLAEDPDHEPLSYELVSGPAGMTIDSVGHVRWQTTPNTSLGDRQASVIVRDGRGGSVSQSFTVTVRADTTAPRVAIIISNPILYPWSTDPARVRVSASDDVGVAVLAVTVDGEPVALGPDGAFTVFFSAPGGGRIEAAATDAAGNRGRNVAQVSMRSGTEVGGDFTPNGPPQVAITSQADGDQVRGLVQVIGSATSPDLTDYTLSYRRAGETNSHEISRGTGQVNNALLGQWDTSQLENDEYIVRLEASDLYGNFSAVERRVGVSGALKMGNFRLTFADLTIPVAGIPITVARSYDTLRAGRSGEFGYGWQLEFRNVDLRTSVGRSGLEDTGVYAPYSVGARVYITLPGGERQGFTFTPDLRVLRGFGQGNNLTIATPRFTPDLGVTSQLSVRGGNLLVNDFDELYATGGIPWNPASPDFGGGFTLTTADGTRYFIDGNSGELQTVFDRNGNTLTFSDRGIVSSTGVQVAFERDAQGRIVTVIDPAGKAIRYSYTATGDLGSVTDQDRHTTQFQYRTTPPHFMERVIDPLGRTGMRVDYGPDGRLNQVSDANGQTSHIDYDLNGRQQSLTDSLGNLTLIQYDLRGNVVAQIDPLGGVTRHAYDQNDREVSLTDPLGRTTSWTYDAAGNVLTITDPLGRVTRQTFNEFGQGLSIIDPLGRATRTTYDARGNAVRIVGADGLAIDLENDPAGNLTALVGAGGRRGTLAYDANGRLVNMADPRGEVTSQRYDSNGRLIGHTTVMSAGGTQSTRSTTFELSASGRLLSTTDSAGGVTRYQYDVQGNRTVQVDALNHATSQEFDLTNRLVKTVDPDGLATQLSYDALGRLAATTDRGGHTTKFAFDPLGRIVETILPDATPGTDLDNPRTHTEFDLVGQTTATIDPLGRRTEYAYDLVGRVTRVRNAAGGETHYEYDAADRLVAITDPMGATTRFVYDLGDRLVETQFADGRTTKNQYDERRRRIVSTDAAGVSTRFEYDAFDRLIAVQDALGGRTLYTYNAEGQLIRQTDANGHATQYAYDRLGRLVQTTLPLGQVSTADYDLANRVVRSQDLNGQVTTADFDSMGHLATQRFADGTTIEFAYTPSGQISRTTDSLGVTEFSYDERDRLILKTNPDGQKIGYAYDAVGNRTAMTTAAGTTHYAYDTLNRLVSVTATDGSVTAYEYDAAGRLLRATTPDGVVETRQYDLRGRVMELDSRLAGGAQLAHYSYRRDPTGRIVQVQESSGRTVDYVYDATYRLVRETILETGHGPRTISYSYDAVGNRLARNDSAAGTTLYFYDANDRLLRENGPAGETRFVYDAQGNLLSRTGPLGDTTNYRWNVRQQLVEVVSTTGGATHTTAFRYDADGLRVAQIVDGVETRLLLDLSQANPTVVLEYAPSGVVLRETVFGLGPISEARGGGTAYFHLDAHSGIRKVVDAAGQVQQTFAYDAFGRLLASTGLAGDALLYRGEMRSQSTGLDYLRTRWLDTETGRFLSRDPFAGTLLNPLSLNDYLYASADPINNSDPSGLSPYSEQLVSLAVRGILLSIPAALVLTPVINYTTTGNASWDGLGNNLLVGMSIGGLVAISPLAGIVSATIGVLGASATATSVITDPNASPLRKILAGALVVGAGLGAAKARGRYIESPTLLNPKFSGKKLLIVGTPKQNSEVVPEWQKNHAFSIDRTPPEQITDGVFANLQGRDINDLNLVNLFGRTIRQIQLPNIPFADPAEAGAAGVNGKLLAQQATRLGAQLVYGVVGGLSKGTVNFLEELQIRGWAIQVILQENNSYIFTAQR